MPVYRHDILDRIQKAKMGHKVILWATKRLMLWEWIVSSWGPKAVTRFVHWWSWNGKFTCTSQKTTDLFRNWVLPDVTKKCRSALHVIRLAALCEVAMKENTSWNLFINLYTFISICISAGVCWASSYDKCEPAQFDRNASRLVDLYVTQMGRKEKVLRKILRMYDLQVSLGLPWPYTMLITKCADIKLGHLY